jgi:hypothetical protein
MGPDIGTIGLHYRRHERTLCRPTGSRNERTLWRRALLRHDSADAAHANCGLTVRLCRPCQRHERGRVRCTTGDGRLDHS